MSRKDEFVADARRYTRAIWDNLNALRALQVEWSALDYGSTLGDHEGFTSAEIGAAVFDTANAFADVLSQGHATNMAKLL